MIIEKTDANGHIKPCKIYLKRMFHEKHRAGMQSVLVQNVLNGL